MHMAHKTAVASLIHYEKNTFKASGGHSWSPTSSQRAGAQVNSPGGHANATTTTWPHPGGPT